MPLLAITALLFWLQRRIIARKGYVALTGKGGERRLIELGGMALGDVGLLPLRHVALVLPAHGRRAAGGVREGVGPRLLARQSHPPQPFASSSSTSRSRARRRSHTFVYGGRRRRHRPRARPLPRLCRPPPPAARGAAPSRTSRWRPSSSRASCSRSASTPPTRTPPLALYGTALDPDPGLHHALPADRLRQQRRRHPQHQPGAGGGGAHPGRRPPHWPCAASWRRSSSAGWLGAFILVFIPATRELSVGDLPLHDRAPRCSRC